MGCLTQAEWEQGIDFFGGLRKSFLRVADTLHNFSHAE
jgi:hypothetical protein